ncbi:MAG: hypothetical protein HRT72_09170, partial [Flavobacteriales bacterium]|nr:hypothetical protein [Flavobacteriales bacterium]
MRIKHVVIFIGLLALSFSNAKSADLECLSVVDVSNVYLNWALSTDTCQQFNSYKVYGSENQSGPYLLKSEIIDYSVGSVNINLFRTDSISYFFFIRQSATCGGVTTNLDSDTLSSIVFELEQSNEGVAILNWSSINTSGNNVSVDYKIYRRWQLNNGPYGAWHIVNTVTQLNYTDTNMACGSNVEYRIVVGDSATCVSSSFIQQDYFTNLLAPNAPVIDSVSV